MSGFTVEARDLSLRYGRTLALDAATFSLPAGGIHGLLGRNGSGKTSLLSVVAALRPASGGQVLVDGEDPFENARIMEGTCIIREGGDLLPTERVSTNLRYFASVRPTWDLTRAGELVEAFGIAPDKRVSALSRGQRSALGAVVGIASRTPLTIFDEVYLGMDAPSRQRFYDELLADTVAHPRTVIVSSHLIDEIDHLLERVLILDNGRVVIAEDADTLRGRGATLTGPAATVARAVDGLNVVGERHLGPVRQVTVFDDLDDGALAAARDAGLEIGPVPLQDLFIHLTGSR